MTESHLPRLILAGDGQLAWLLHEAARRLGIDCLVLGSDVRGASCRHIKDFATFSEFCNKPASFIQNNADVLSFESENINIESFENLALLLNVLPALGNIALFGDRLSEKSYYQSLEIAVPKFIEYSNNLSFDQLSQELGLPFVIKTSRGGYDGKGQWKISSAADLKQIDLRDCALRQAMIAEEWLNFDGEVSQISCRSRSGEIVHYPLTINLHHAGILRHSRPMDKEHPLHKLSAAAQKISETILCDRDYVGTIAIEFFVYKHTLMVNEVAPRVHNSGHWSLDAGICSQFENHIRALFDLPLGPTSPAQPVLMINYIGQEILAPRILDEFPHAKIYDYHKDLRNGRKMGHINLPWEFASADGSRIEGILKRLALK